MNFEDWCDIIDATMTNRLGARFLERTKSGSSRSAWTYGKNRAEIVLQKPPGLSADIYIDGKHEIEFSLMAKAEWVGESVAAWLVTHKTPDA